MLFVMYTHKSTSTVPKSLQYTIDHFNKIPNWRQDTDNAGANCLWIWMSRSGFSHEPPKSL